MIVMRLFLYRRSIKQLVGAEYAGQYTSFLSMLIESGLIMDVTVVCTIIMVAIRSPMLALPLLSLTEVQVRLFHLSFQVRAHDTILIILLVPGDCCVYDNHTRSQRDCVVI